MARKKSTTTINNEIEKIESEISKLNEKKDILSKKLKELQEQKRKFEADKIMDAYLKSGKSIDDIMTFLEP